MRSDTLTRLTLSVQSRLTNTQPKSSRAQVSRLVAVPASAHTKVYVKHGNERVTASRKSPQLRIVSWTSRADVVKVASLSGAENR